MAAALEDELLRRGVQLLKGARAVGIDQQRRRRHRSAATTGASPRGSHALLAIGSIPNSEGLGLERRRRGGRCRRLRAGRRELPHQRRPHLRGRRPVGEAAAVVGGLDAGPQDRRARDGRAVPRAAGSSTTTRRPPPSSPSRRSPTSGWPRPTPSPKGRKVRVTKVPFSASPKALIESHSRGFVKIVSDPATGRGAGRVDRRPPRRRADLGDRRGRHQRPHASPTSSTASSCTPRCPRRWPRRPSDAPDAGADRARAGRGRAPRAGRCAEGARPDDDGRRPPGAAAAVVSDRWCGRARPLELALGVGAIAVGGAGAVVGWSR